MPSSQLAEYLLHSYIREELTPEQQAKMLQLLVDFKLRVREEAARPITTFLAQFLDRFDKIQAEQAEHHAAITKLYTADAEFLAAIDGLRALIAERCP